MTRPDTPVGNCWAMKRGMSRSPSGAILAWNSATGRLEMWA